MCIMEVRPGQHHSTIAQAQAHNVGTVVGDFELFETLLAAKGRLDILETVGELHKDLEAIYNRLLDLWGDFLSEECDHLIPDGAVPPDLRDYIAQRVHEDQHRAQHYETR